MRRHDRKERGAMGVTVLAVAAIFLVLHLALPGVTLWPAFLVCLGVATVIASHLGGGHRHSRGSVAASSETD
jgi:hypothetical protein